MSYVLIGRLKKKAVTTAQACRALGVSRSGYYSAANVNRAAPKVCDASERTYGSRRLCAALQSQGISIGRHRVRSLMRANQLRSVWKRKFVHTTDSKHALPIAENLLDRQFASASPNEAWVSYFRPGLTVRQQSTSSAADKAWPSGQHGP